jgi:hypothetical protein
MYLMWFGNIAQLLKLEGRGFYWLIFFLPAFEAATGGGGGERAPCIVYVHVSSDLSTSTGGVVLPTVSKFMPEVS